jgi:hypothetical protein
MSEITVAQAINRIAKALMEVADGLEAPPEVDFRVDWIDCGTVTGPQWVPRLAISVESIRKIRLEDM